jgi:hypothetical protein
LTVAPQTATLVAMLHQHIEVAGARGSVIGSPTSQASLRSSPGRRSRQLAARRPVRGADSGERVTHHEATESVFQPAG